MGNDLLNRAREILKDLEYVTIATASGDGQPWNTPVYVAYDDDHNLYWSSWVNAQHSQNIRANNRVFIVAFDSTRVRGDNHQRGVYIQALAEQLENENDITHALKYFKGVGNKELDTSDFMRDSLKKLYKAVPQKMWLNDVSESQVTKETLKMRVEVALS